MEELLLTLLVMCLVAGGVTLVVVWRVVRWVRRSPMLRRRVRSVQALTTPPGARRQVACLRRDLNAAAHATGEAVALVRAAGGTVGDLPLLARRLGRVAGTLDAELRLLAHEPDPAELARVLPAARARVVDVTRVSDSCGYGVPLMDYRGEREHQAKSSAKRVRVHGPGAYEDYKAEKNARSIDGLPGVG